MRDGAVFGSIGDTHAACFVVDLVLHIFPAQSAGAEGVFSRTAFAVYDGTFEVGVILDGKVKAFVSGVNACLVCHTFVMGVYVRFTSRSKAGYFAGGNVIA